MKKVRILALAALVCFAAVSAANATGFVWASASGSTGGGTPGTALDLTCNTSTAGPTRCEWLITVAYQTDGYAGGGWMLDLLPDAASIDKLHVKNATYGSSPASDPNNNSPFVLNGDPNGDGYSLINSAGSATFAATPAGTYTLLTFLLSKNKQPGQNQTSTIFFRVGFGEWGGNDGGGYETVGFGPNPPRPGTYTGEAEPLPFIVIHNVPEPTTLGLLGLGLVGLLRRRR